MFNRRLTLLYEKDAEDLSPIQFSHINLLFLNPNPNLRPQYLDQFNMLDPP